MSLFERVTKRETKDGAVTAGVFIPLPKPIAKRFPNKDKYDDSDPHVTLLFVGDITAEQQAKLVYGIKKIAAHIKPFKMDMGSYDEFQNHEGQTIANMRPTASHPHDLNALHVALWRAADDAGVPVGHRYGDYEAGLPDAAAFKSHATLQYMEPGQTYKGPKPKGSWTVKELEVWGHQKDKIPLGSALAEGIGPMKRWGLSKIDRRALLDVGLGRTISPSLMKKLQGMGLVHGGKLTASGRRSLNLMSTLRRGALKTLMMEVRPSCVMCVCKHLAQALVLSSEAKQGYPGHRWIVIGHMGEAADECVQEYPKLAAEIRKHRLAYMRDKDYVIPFMKLIEKASALTEESAMSSGAVRVSTKCPKCGAVGHWTRTGDTFRCSKCKALMAESTDFPHRYSSPTAGSSRTGMGTAPVEDPEVLAILDPKAGRKRRKLKTA